MNFMKPGRARPNVQQMKQNAQKKASSMLQAQSQEPLTPAQVTSSDIIQERQAAAKPGLEIERNPFVQPRPVQAPTEMDTSGPAPIKEPVDPAVSNAAQQALMGNLIPKPQMSAGSSRFSRLRSMFGGIKPFGK